MTAVLEDKIVQMHSEEECVESLVAIKIRSNGKPRIQVVAEKLEHKALLAKSMQLAVDRLNQEIERELGPCFSFSQSSRILKAS
jgi:hypothetical protein